MCICARIHVYIHPYANVHSHVWCVFPNRWFNQWRERKQIKFHFGKYEVRTTSRGLRRGRRVVLTLPLKYSRRVQTDGAGFFFPSEGDVWLCALALGS